MDMIYDNLENFTEEATNAELREENGNLKIKLEEYAKELEQLQKNFDTLVLEHKKLEFNYSSLLKTARSEIERKTQIITKLNIEKDALVLNSVQNRNTHYHRQKPKTSEPKNKEEPRFGNASKSQYRSDSDPKPSHLNQASNERNIKTRQLDANKSVGNSNLNTSRNDAVKENVMVKDEQRSIAKIFERRKSMPVYSMECSKFSSDEEEVASSGSSKDFVPKEPSDHRYPDRYPRDKLIMEHKTFGHYPCKKETRSHFSKYDSLKHRNQDNYDQSQKYKRNQSSDRKRRSPDKKKASLERRRGSPEGKRKDFRNYSTELHKRQEHDRHRRMGSPSKDKYHDFKHRSRDSQHSNERYLKQEFERYKSRSQDKNITKHKIMNDFEEPSNKRMRIDSYHKHEEDRWRVERQAGPASLEMDSLNMSCQSPDQSHFDASHQTREIKLTASTQLDDPRLSSQKYCLKTHDGKAELSTVDSAIIDVKVIDSSCWDTIKTMKVPEALLTKPVSPEVPSASLLQRPITVPKPMISDTLNASLTQKSSEIRQKNIQNPMSSGLSDAVSSMENIKKPPKIIEKQKILSKSTTSNVPKSKSSDMPDILSQKPISGEESKLEDLNKKSMTHDDLVNEIYMDIENPISNMSIETCDVYNFDDNFHNPEESKNDENTTDFTSKLEVPKDEQPSNTKTTKRSSSDKQTDSIRKGVTVADDNSNEKANPPLKSKLTHKRRSSDFDNYISAKEIIAGDLELSDETSDNTDMPITKQKQVSKAKEDSEINDSGLDSDKKIKTKKTDTKIALDGTSSKKVEDNNLSEITDDVMLDVRKSKGRKKLIKLKEAKESQISRSKPAKKQEITQELTENPNTSVSIEELVKIKENITKELANQPILLDKQIKKKENKSKPEETALDDMSVKKKEIQPIGLLGISDKAGPIKKKDNKSVKLPGKKETASVEKPEIKKEIKVKESSESIHDIPMDKTVKNKSNIQESSTNIKKESMNKKVEKKDDQFKTKTKFNELFGDSSSLVSPEDLGLVPTVVAPSENYIAMFEDAQDALDINSVRTTLSTEPTKKTNDTEIKTQHNFSINKPVSPAEPTYQQKKVTANVESIPNTSFTNQEMYQNLQPEFQQGSNIVKTVIISSGVQPQCTLDATETYPHVSDTKNTDLHVMQCVKPTILQNVALQALATSTPQKIWDQNVQIEEPSISSRCENREESIGKAPTAACLSNSTQSNMTDEPDVTIFVKRRRKVLKKK